MTHMTTVMNTDLTSLRNQHAVGIRAIGTIQNELSRVEPYPELHAKMRADKERSVTQAACLDALLAKHDTGKARAKEVVGGAVATVAGFAHVAADDEVMENVLAAVGLKTHEIGSYKALLADAAGAVANNAVLEQLMREEQEMGDGLGSCLPSFVGAYLEQWSA